MTGLIFAAWFFSFILCFVVLELADIVATGERSGTDMNLVFSVLPLLNISIAVSYGFDCLSKFKGNK